MAYAEAVNVVGWDALAGHFILPTPGFHGVFDQNPKQSIRALGFGFDLDTGHRLAFTGYCRLFKAQA